MLEVGLIAAEYGLAAKIACTEQYLTCKSFTHTEMFRFLINSQSCQIAVCYESLTSKVFHLPKNSSNKKYFVCVTQCSFCFPFNVEKSNDKSRSQAELICIDFELLIY